ncbi:CGNR zinc finger domain-containing protein [Paenibacillus glycanilyticus]|uniref:CGNR zinc finger domain-containing protein n=1 Tax=Paenibacillus glycanilyticus TaxID=126569 RepID=UPI0019101E54|nr:CGNR zinc finger domain-containing protein [Paenibacillus glycanilyticus]
MLWDDFLKSDYHDWKGSGYSEDRLDKPGWLEQLLTFHNLPYPGAPSESEMDNLKQLRSEILRIVQKLTSHLSTEPSDFEGINRTLSDGPVILRITETESKYQLESLPIQSGWSRIRVEIATSFVRLLTEGDPARLRICENPDCMTVYYDETRNCSKRFCDNKVCGNLMKVRRFRARQKSDKT